MSGVIKVIMNVVEQSALCKTIEIKKRDEQSLNECHLLRVN